MKITWKKKFRRNGTEFSKVIIDIGNGYEKTIIKDFYGICSVLKKRKANGDAVIVEKLVGWKE